MSELDRLGHLHASRIRSSVSGASPPSIDDPVVVQAGASSSPWRWAVVGVTLTVVFGAIVLPQVFFGHFDDPADPTTVASCDSRWSRRDLIAGGLSGHPTPALAAESERKAIIDSGGHPDGRPVAELVAEGDLTFRIPYEAIDSDRGPTDIMIEVISIPGGTGYAVVSIELCEESVTDAFWRWPSEEGGSS